MEQEELEAIAKYASRKAEVERTVFEKVFAPAGVTADEFAVLFATTSPVAE